MVLEMCHPEARAAGLSDPNYLGHGKSRSWVVYEFPCITPPSERGLVER